MIDFQVVKVADNAEIMKGNAANYVGLHCIYIC